MIKKIFLVHHTHMDIGYTDQPAEVLDQQLRFLDAAIALGGRDSRFHWTIESAYLLKDYLRNRQPEAVEALFRLLRNGQFELGAFEVQPLTELMTQPELIESVGFAAAIGRKEGFPVENAMLNDIGGFAAMLPSALASQGVRFLTCGVGAFQVFLPWARLPHLFHWEDAGGKRLLVWNLGIDRDGTPWDSRELMAVYGMGANFVIQPYLRYFELGTDRQVELEGEKKAMTEPPDAPFRRLEARLEHEHYPYEEIMLQYGGDNRWPSAFLTELLQRIGAEGSLPPIELTTPSRFFRFMLDKYAGDIPVRRGVITDPWITRVNPAPEPLKYFLAAQRRRQYIENRGGAVSETLKEHLALYADHTCGLSEWHAPELNTDAVPNDPVFENLRASWRSKRRYAEAADAESADILRRWVNRHTAASALTLFNHASVPQSGIVELTLGRDLPQLEALALPDGTKLTWQETGHQRYWVEVPEVPPGAVIPLTAGFGPVPEYFVKAPETLEPLPAALEATHFHCDFDLATGRIRRLTSADGAVVYGDGSLFEVKLQLPENYVLNWEEAGMRPLRDSRFPEAEITRCGLRHQGAVGWCVEQRGTLAERVNYRLLMAIYRNRPYIDVECFLDKTAHRELESIYLACQLAGRASDWGIGQHGWEIDPARDLLPGSMRDLFYAPRGARLRTPEFTAMMQGFDAPVLHLGRPRLFAWDAERDFRGEPAAFYWNIYQNLLVSDCPAWQPILNSFRFRLFLGAPEEFPPAPDSLQIA